MQKQFTINRASFTLSRKDIIDSIRGRRPESIRRYYVEISGAPYPIKQVLGKTLAHKDISLFRADFTSQCATSILRNLGFEVKRVNRRERELRRKLQSIAESTRKTKRKKALAFGASVEVR